MKLLYITTTLLFLVGCNPCKYVSKHQECFPADTVKQIEYKTKYIKEYITNDSIVYQTEPCNPKDSLVYRTKTEYRTKNIIKVDTIYSDKEVIKVNPLNEELKSENSALKSKLTNRNKQTLALGIVILLIGFGWWLKRKLKFVF